MATNISNYPGTGYTSTFVQRITKSAVSSISTDPILLKFLKNDASFGRDLSQSFDRGDVANIVVAPTLTAVRSTNLSDTVSYQTAAFTSVQVTLDTINYVAFKYRDAEIVMSDTDIKSELEDSAGKAIVRDIYSNVVSKFVNDALISSDQRVGTLGIPLNFNALRRLRTLAEKQYGIKRDERLTLIVNPDAYEALLGDSNFQNQISGDSQTIINGVISAVLNMEVYSDPMLGNNGGGSQSISGSAGFIGVGFVDSSAVLVTRQLPLTDQTRQYRASFQGVSTLYTKTPDSQFVGGLMVQDKIEILYGFKALPQPRWIDGATHTKIFPILGGI